MYLHSTINTTNGYTNEQELYICLLMYVQLRLEMQVYPKTIMIIYQKQLFLYCILAFEYKNELFYQVFLKHKRFKTSI